MTATAHDPDRLSPAEQAAAVASMEGYCWHKGRQFWLRGGRRGDLDDYAAAARVGFVIAAGRFRPSSGNRFSTYGCWWALQQLQAYQKQEAGGGIGQPREGPDHRLRGAIQFSQVGEIPDREGAAAAEPGDWEGLTRALGPQQRRVLHLLHLLYVEGLTLAEAGRRLGLSKARVQQVHAEAAERLRASAEVRAYAGAG